MKIDDIVSILGTFSWSVQVFLGDSYSLPKAEGIVLVLSVRPYKGMSLLPLI